MKDRYKEGRTTAYITIAINALLTAIKLLAATMAHSTAMMADAAHSASDILTTIAVIISFKIAGKPEDAEHPYGHEKAESIGAKIVAVLLLFAGLGIGFKAIGDVKATHVIVPGSLALYAAILSIVIKEAMFWYTLFAAKRINSTALKADAWHHRSDAISSVATFIGIGAARIGFPLGDTIAALIVTIMICKVALDIMKKSIKELMDSSAPIDTINAISRSIESVSGVKGIDSIKTRVHGHLIYADIEIQVDESISISDGHKIAHKVESKILSDIEDVKGVMIHVHPV